jgi:hypothetical protein
MRVLLSHVPVAELRAVLRLFWAQRGGEARNPQELRSFSLGNDVIWCSCGSALALRSVFFATPKQNQLNCATPYANVLLTWLTAKSLPSETDCTILSRARTKFHCYF